MDNDTKKTTNAPRPHGDLKARVIVTYGRSLMALTIAHSLGKRGIEVIGCDDVDMTVMHFSKYVSECFIHAPYEKDEDAFLNDLEDNIKRLKPDDDRPYILIPTFRDNKILSKHKDRFKDLITLACPDYDSLDPVHPKDVFARTCEKLDLPIPKTYQPEKEEDLNTFTDDALFPLLIKPVDEKGGRGICKVKTYIELQKACKKSREKYGRYPLIQDIIDGRDYCVAFIADQGEIVSAMAYKNLYQFPYESGAGIMRETISPDPFLGSAAPLIRHLKWHGVGEIDYRWSEQETDPPFLIEVNPRFWAGLAHSVESGADFPWMLYQLFANGKIDDIGELKIGAKTKIPALWTISALQDIAESETHFDALQNAWKQLWAHSPTPLQDRFATIGQAFQNLWDEDDIHKKLKSMQTQAKDAVNEFNFDDDPYIGLGFLFIFSSLFRHGTLPPELKG